MNAVVDASATSGTMGRGISFKSRLCTYARLPLRQQQDNSNNGNSHNSNNSNNSNNSSSSSGAWQGSERRIVCELRPRQAMG